MITPKRQLEFNARVYSTSWQPSPVTQRRIAKIVSLVGSEKRVLDVGCYDGTLAALLKAKDNIVVAIDISPAAVKLACKKGIAAHQLNIESQNIPPNYGHFDVILASEIIEHIFNTDAFLQKLRSVLKPDGQLILTTPNIASLGSRLSLMFGVLPWMIENDIRPGRSGHIRYFTPKVLTDLLRHNGFSVTSFHTDGVGFGSNTNFPFIDKFFPQLGRILIVIAKPL